MNIEFVDQVWWYTSRAAGIIAWLLLSGSILAGLAVSTRATQLPASWRVDLHRWFSTLALAFLGLHMVALVPDNFVYFAWAEILVPMASEWQPAAVAWGVIAFWLLVAVEVTSLVRARLPYRLWRAVHLLSAAVWVLATLHLLTAGTDAGHPVFRAVQVTIAAAVGGATAYRLVTMFSRRRSKPSDMAERPGREHDVGPVSAMARRR